MQSRHSNTLTSSIDDVSSRVCGRTDATTFQFRAANVLTKCSPMPRLPPEYYREHFAFSESVKENLTNDQSCHKFVRHSEFQRAKVFNVGCCGGVLGLIYDRDLCVSSLTAF